MENNLIDIWGSNFMPHGHCYFWTPEILWPHAISDIIIAIAYFSIPLSLFYLFRKRSDVKFVWMMILFAVFILGCGLTHVMDVITIWKPWYVIDNVIRSITAVASIGTAIVLIKITPQILKIPTSKQWEDVNKALQDQISELKEKDKTIEAFKQFEFLTDTLPQLVISTDNSGIVSFYNQRWYEFTGLPFERSVFKAFEKVIHPDYLDEMLLLLANGFAENKSFQSEMYLRNSQGEYCWHLAKGIPVDISKEKSWIITATDIHEQRQYNDALEKKNRQLQIINNDMDNFIYTASHDLKSPISNFEGLLLALEKEKSEKKSESEMVLLQHMEKNITKFKKTINELMEISKIQREIDEEKEQINLKELVKEVINDFDFTIRETEAALILDLQTEYISFSKKNFRSILSILLSNSLKYRAENRKLIIKITASENENQSIIKVIDNGLGFNVNKDKVFGMFKRFHNHVEGSGIGLYIVKKIMDNYGGKIEVESKEDEGSTFTLIISK